VSGPLLKVVKAKLVIAEEFGLAIQFRDGALEGAAEVAARLSKKVADSGHVQAQGEVTRCLLDGTGVKIDAVAAFRYARMGHAMLAWCYRKASGVARDPKKQAEHAERSADAGNRHGLVEWGCCLMSGSGMAKSEAAGIQLIQRSAEAGCPWGIVKWGWGPRAWRGSDAGRGGRCSPFQDRC
jgi:TPR repeat protein